VLALDGEQTMIQQTLQRLIAQRDFGALANPEDVWVITNTLLRDTIASQLEQVPCGQILAEPAARNTAPAAGLAAFLMERIHPDAVLGVFPADHVIADEAAFVSVLRQAIELAAAGENIVVLGIEPTRPETGYGYIQTGTRYDPGVLRVQRFLEKPNRERAEEFVASGACFWNSGIFVWRARTLANAVREYLPDTARLLEEIAGAWGTPQFAEKFAALYPRCQDISVDYAVLEPRSKQGEEQSRLYCLPTRFGWNDLGSWTALHEHQVQAGRGDTSGNVMESAGSISLDAHNNYVYSPKRFVALVGVQDLVVVETEDALLITDRHHAQDVGKVVKSLAGLGREELI
jgi:mannose-1-phosphate guanylyltransferase